MPPLPLVAVARSSAVGETRQEEKDGSARMSAMSFARAKNLHAVPSVKCQGSFHSGVAFGLANFCRRYCGRYCYALSSYQEK